jgi:hypothetical protein
MSPLEGEGLVIVGQGTGEVALAGVGQPPVIVGRGVVGSESDGLVQAGGL